MGNRQQAILKQLFIDYPKISVCKQDIEVAFGMLRECYINKGKVLVCGNGGSAADSEHIVGELMKGFLLKRKIDEAHIEKLKKEFPEDWQYLSNKLQGSLPAISLVSQSAISTAFINDVAADMVFAQQVYGYAFEGDILIGLSTSGNSSNVINAFKIAKTFGMKTIGMTGKNGGKMNGLCDVIIRVPSDITYKIQECHLPIYHVLCAMIEAEIFDD